jgi:hypothetical protein
VRRDAQPLDIRVTSSVPLIDDLVYRARIEAAFQLIFGASAKEGLDELLILERKLSPRKLSQKGDSCIFYWTQLQRAFAYEELSLLSQSQRLLEQLIRKIQSGPSSVSSIDCPCDIFSTARISLARVHASKGEFSVTLRHLSDLSLDIENGILHYDASRAQEIGMLGNYCLEFLGYDAVFQLPVQGRAASQIPSAEHWEAPIPIGGEVYAQRAANYALRWQEFNEIDDEHRYEKYEALKVLLKVVQLWCRECPSAVRPRRLLVTYQLWQARYEIDFSMFEDLEASMANAQSNLEALGEAEEIVTDLLIVTRSLVALAIDVAYHKYANDDARRRYLPLSYGCVVTAKSLMDAVLEDSPVNQAVAIILSLLLNIASSIYEWLGRYPEATAEMGKCVAVMHELMKRDPSNDRGRRLLESYESALNSSDESAEDYARALRWKVDNSRYGAFSGL